MIDANSDIIDRCRRGDRKAQLQLYTNYSKRVYNSCYRILQNQYEAEDAMQESFLKVLSNLDQYEEHIVFEAWITRIAINTSIDKFRRKNLQTSDWTENVDYEIIDDDETEQLEYTLDKVEQVKEAIKQLKEIPRMIVTLYLIEGYDQDEISEILDIKPSTVRVQYMRAKQRITELIESSSCL